MKKTNIFGLVLILSTLLIGCAQPNMCADIPEVYTITCGDNVRVNKTQAMAGEMITVEATPGTNQRVASIKQNDVSLRVTDNRATFEMPAGNVNVTATFTQLYTISSTVTGGTITIPASAASGDIVSFSTTYDTDWYDSNCTISVSDSNGNTITVSNNSFTMPAGNVNIGVVYPEHDFANDSNIILEFYLLSNKDICINEFVYCDDDGYVSPFSDDNRLSRLSAYTLSTIKEKRLSVNTSNSSAGNDYYQIDNNGNLIIKELKKNNSTIKIYF